MSKFKPIPAKVHKTKRHVRVITAAPKSYKPKLRKISGAHPDVQPTPHRRTFFKRKRQPAPKAPIRYKHKTDTTLNYKFVLLMVLLIVLMAIFITLVMYLMP